MHCESALTVGTHCILVSPPVYPFIGRIKNCHLAKYRDTMNISRISANYREIRNTESIDNSMSIYLLAFYLVFSFR